MIRSAKFITAGQQFRLAAFAVLAALLGACSSQGIQGTPQQPLLPTLPQQVQPQSPDASIAQADATATTGPIVFICDNNGKLFTLNLGTDAVHFVGFTGAALTDLGFDPKNHVLYGITFDSFFRVSTTTGKITFIGNLGINDANALVFDANGKGYVKGFTDTELYTVNVATGAVSPIGPTGKWESAGDLTFYNNTLLLSGFTGPDPFVKDSLVTLDHTTGAVISVKPMNLALLYGLVSTAPGKLYGFANTSLYKLNPAAPTAAGRATLIKDLAPSGVGQITGAAYNGNFQI